MFVAEKVLLLLVISLTDNRDKLSIIQCRTGYKQQTFVERDAISYKRMT